MPREKWNALKKKIYEKEGNVIFVDQLVRHLSSTSSGNMMMKITSRDWWEFIIYADYVTW